MRRPTRPQQPLLPPLNRRGACSGLAELERIAIAQQPQMLAAHAQTRIAEAGAEIARSPLLPQVTGVAQYTRETGNFAPRPGAVPAATAGNGVMVTATPTTSLTQSYDYWNFGLTGTQLIYDFGQTFDKYRAARETEDAQGATEAATRFVVLSSVRAAYFTARSNKDLIDVAREFRGSGKAPDPGAGLRAGGHAAPDRPGSTEKRAGDSPGAARHRTK